MRKLIIILSMVAALTGCKSASAPKRAINDSGMMYAMVYDYENTPVSGASIFINGKKYIETDLQGRFILEFRKGGEYTIRVEKLNYEVLEDTFSYDPMNVLYFKMINASQLLSQAEEALDQYSYAEAELFIGRALALEPNRPDLLYFQSIVFYRQERNDEARAILESLLYNGMKGDYIIEFLKLLTN